MADNKLKHIAIMMDGNGRWARKKGEERTYGHVQGEKKFEEICLAMDERKIKYLTVYAFSTENWRRPKDEVDAIFNLLKMYFNSCEEMAEERDFRISVIGNIEILDGEFVELISRIEKKTKKNKGMHIQIAINYGGRDELRRSLIKIATDVSDGVIDLKEIDEKLINSYLDTEGIPEPDIVIRTGGEKRLSNFLLWQIAYSELFFCDKYWPDFSSQDIDLIIQNYAVKERRYGGISTK